MKFGGSRNTGSKHFQFLQANFRTKMIFSGNFTPKFDFPGKFLKNFDLFKQFHKKIYFPGKNWPFIATSGQIILFFFRSHHFRTYFLYIIRYNNISRPIQDPHDSPCPKSWGSRPPIPRIDAPGLELETIDI